MKDIQIGTVIAYKRKEKGLTQDQLASYMGVSKTAVSKWETNQSFPDVTFLPILASFFDISIDTLIGYEPQMTNEDITLFYRNMCTAFVQQPLEEVLAQLDQKAKKYHSCYTLLLYISLLYINHLNLLPAEQTTEMILKAKELLVIVRLHSTKLREQRMALECEAMCELVLKEPHKAIALLDKIEPISSNAILAQSYQQNQEVDKAIEVLQADMLQSISILCNSAQMIIPLYIGNKEKIEEILLRIKQLDEIFNLKKLNFGVILPIIINAFSTYAMMQDREMTYHYLHEYVDLMDQAKTFHNQFDEFFDHVGQATFKMDISIDLPRNESVIKMSCLQCVKDAPVLAWLAQEEEFQQIVKRLEAIVNRTSL